MCRTLVFHPLALPVLLKVVVLCDVRVDTMSITERPLGQPLPPSMISVLVAPCCVMLRECHWDTYIMRCLLGALRTTLSGLGHSAQYPTLQDTARQVCNIPQKQA